MAYVRAPRSCKVYRFEYQDWRTGAWLLADDFALESAITEIRARKLVESEMTVDPSRISRCGYLFR